jgi:uroporphyrinogen-III synthase
MAEMPQPLENITVAILEHRFTKEFSTLFEKAGASVYACPMLEERPVENRGELQMFVRRVASGELDVMIFLTGVGARFLVSEAESLGLKDDFLNGLAKCMIVVRGPKPVTVLRQIGVHVDVIPENPTTEGVIEALRHHDLRSKRVGVQLYGTPNPQLISALESKDATAVPVQVYAYGAASDTSAVSTMINRLVKGDIQVVVFTSAPQVKMLFEFATQLGSADALQVALDRTTIASIGEVTNRALAERNLSAKIIPSQAKMGALVLAVSEHFSSNRAK